MVKQFFCGVLAAVLAAAIPTPALAARQQGFEDYGGYSETKTEYSFLYDQSALVYGKEVNLDYTSLDLFYSGSDLYVPIGALDTTKDNAEELIATDKQIKNDNVQLSYKVLRGAEYVDAITMVSGKKEKLKDLPAGMYAKVEFADTFLPLNKSRVSVRLVLSVNGVSYQDTGVTFHADLQNRVEHISRNSVYGAITPSQFKVASNYRSEATFDFGSQLTYTARVAAGQKYYLNLDRSANANLAEMYPDAYLEFYTFHGNNDTFASTGRLEIPVNKPKFKGKKTRAQVYAYEVVNNELFALDQEEITYDSKTNKLLLQTRTLGNYVLADRALMKTVAPSSEHDILRSGYAESVSEEDEPSTSSSSAKSK